MIANWIHVMIVHFAIIGTPWLLYRVWIHRQISLESKSWKLNYTAVLVLGAIAAVAYFTGPEAADYAKVVVTDYDQDHVEDHALWGRVAFVIQGVAALVGVMAWASILQEEKPDKRIPAILLVLLSLNTLVLIYASHLGGLIRRMDLMF